MSTTLTLDLKNSSNSFIIDNIEKESKLENSTHASTWKLKWYSKDTLLKFLTLIKAIHAELSERPLPVKYVS